MTNSSICCTSAAPSGHFSIFLENLRPACPAFRPVRRSCHLFFRRTRARLATRSVLSGAFAACFFGELAPGLPRVQSCPALLLFVFSENPRPACPAFSSVRRSCCLCFRRTRARLAPRSVLPGALAACFFGEPAPGSSCHLSYICFAVLPRYYL